MFLVFHKLTKASSRVGQFVNHLLLSRPSSFSREQADFIKPLQPSSTGQSTTLHQRSSVAAANCFFLSFRISREFYLQYTHIPTLFLDFYVFPLTSVSSFIQLTSSFLTVSQCAAFPLLCKQIERHASCSALLHLFMCLHSTAAAFEHLAMPSCKSPL